MKLFFKEDLGITRSPIANLLKKTNVKIAEEIQNLLDGEFSKLFVKEVIDLFHSVDDKTIKDASKALAKMDEQIFRETVLALLETCKGIEGGIVGKEAAFLSKTLATIITDIEAYQETVLDDIAIRLNQANMKEKFTELAFKSLLDK